MRSVFPVVAPLIAIAAIGLSGCQKPKEIYADQAWVRLPAVAGNPGVAYFTLHGGPADTQLLSVTSPAVIRSELHESMAGGGGMASMKPIGQVDLPAGSKVTFAPGGKHVMLFDINPAIKPGGNLTLVFTFANNLKIEVTAPVVAAGDPQPGK